MAEQTKAYARAGVNIALADDLLGRIKPDLQAAKRPESLGAIGGFGGLFDISRIRLKHPVLVASTDSVGTKVTVSHMAEDFRFLGADIVHHCANDIAVCGAEPLFFLDYYATGVLQAGPYTQLMRGLARACKGANIALVGGETAELPGVYREGEFDIVGTIVGVVDKPHILTGEPIRPGDVVIGLSSSGLHTNGYSLARRIFFKDLGLSVKDPLPGRKGPTVGTALLKPHTNYAPFLQAALKSLNTAPRAAQRRGNALFGAAHITGGGFTGNIPRVLPDNIDVEIDTRAWKRPPVFQALAETGLVSDDELHEVFNMGIGLVLIAEEAAAPALIELARKEGHTAQKIGRTLKGSGQVHLNF